MTKDRKITGSATGDDVFVFGEDLPAPRRPKSPKTQGTRPSTAQKQGARKNSPSKAPLRGPGAGARPRSSAQQRPKASGAVRRPAPPPPSGRGCGSFLMLGLAILVGASGFGIGTLAQAATDMGTAEKVAYAAPASVSREFTF